MTDSEYIYEFMDIYEINNFSFSYIVSTDVLTIKSRKVRLILKLLKWQEFLTISPIRINKRMRFS